MTVCRGPKHRLIRMLLPLAISAAFSGCTGLPFDKPPPRLFVLTPKSAFPESLPKVEWHMAIDVPIAPASLNTSRIAVHRTPLSLDYYEGAAWADTAPKLVQTLLIESFENSGGIVGVARQSITLRADYALVTELREFQSELRNQEPPRIRVRLNAKLIRFPQRTIAATASHEAVTDAESPAIEDVVHAFDEALGKVLKDTVNWALRAVPPSKPSGSPG